MTPDAYNELQLSTHQLTTAHITRLVEYWQRNHGLDDDGKAGPVTLASILPPQTGPLRIESGWLVGPGVKRIAAHASWFGARMKNGRPQGIVAHYTATDPGTAVSMANRRAQPFSSDPDNRMASWHVTVETDGLLVQMIAFDSVAWHAGSSTAKPVPGLGAANYTCVGIELVGHGDAFTAEQVEAALALWRVLVQTYGIAREHAMITHQSIDPTRREDPGPVWMQQYAPSVLEAAYTS